MGARPRSWLAGLASGFTTVVTLFLLAILGAAWAYNAPGPPARKGAETTVVLRKGAGLSEISGQLERAGVVRSAALFLAGAQLSGAARGLKAGEYAFPSRSSLSSVMGKIRDGDIVHHHVTIAEGLTSAQAADIIGKSEVLTGSAPTPPEGALLPETYEVIRGDDRGAVMDRMMTARDRLLAQLWAKRKPDLPFETPEQAVTLASIVEKETALASERPQVAAVYINRLRRGMPLQADPTVVYGVNGGEPLGRGLLMSELQADNPYNTYLNPGLPPTPIGNPGRASLAAVLDPPSTRDLYFVADGTGGHVFAETYDEHEKNVARWREIERQRQASPPALKPAVPPTPQAR